MEAPAVLCEIVAAFCMQKLCHDKFNFGFEEDYAQEVPLQHFVGKCDVLSVHINYLPRISILSIMNCLRLLKSPLFS